MGKTEQQLRAEGADYTVGRLNYIDTGLGIVMEDKEGFAKILVDRKTGRILGSHIMGTDASSCLPKFVREITDGSPRRRKVTRRKRY